MGAFILLVFLVCSFLAVWRSSVCVSQVAKLTKRVDKLCASLGESDDEED